MQSLLTHWADALLAWLGLTSALNNGWDRWVAFSLVLLAVVWWLIRRRLFAPYEMQTEPVDPSLHTASQNEFWNGDWYGWWIIESGTGDAAVIKSHHNVGGLPDYVDFKEIIEPLRMLFKDEVRQLGRELDLPEYLVMRQPFPGPGLAIRVIGEVTKDKLDTLRLADFIFRDEIAKAHLEGTMNQYFAVLTNMRSVGVMGDGRTYDYTLALRSVTTTDFMTADWTRIPYEVLDRISVRIVNEVPHINRIVYDITSKPPATIEWE